MKKTGLALSFLICLTPSVSSQERAPQLVIRAAHCLAVKNSLPFSKANDLTLGYLVDEKSYLGERVLYLVAFPAPHRSAGLVFAIFLTQQGDRQGFNIQNNARFVLSKDGIHGISFVDPPLGGTWTQEHLASAISKIEKQPRFSIPVRGLHAVNHLTYCESYTDVPSH